ncbi:pyridoxamine 5'-phosphate oxidase family protein [Natrinema zhouii]|uniref:Pyridoxamine 5'-phosphate oxidase family protein n=1 Tax=Natrinema zhouii TaxID=1710539 RepID=A0A7D6GT60_9EURY|nr:pyridoxamine 5'-phosphate oxidase family protein [Natrinema zhouii]QLK27842.1 pyridoxamine 5'-phosphate oxidase family protein [Natrinema zhouii]
MTDFRGAWSEDEVATFLQEATIPVRIATHRPDGSLWVVTLWYRYRDGALECATGANADVVRFLRNDPTVAFDISTNDIPYRGIRGNGTVELSSDSEKEVLRDLIERYLGGTDSSLARRLLDDDRDEVRIRLEPRTVYSWDYSERMGTDSSEKSE